MAEDDLADQVVSDAAYGLSSPRPRAFRAWHRPRKQYVRHRQWLKQIRSLVETADFADEVSYLGLPGSDMLDLRHIYSELCAPLGLKLRFLGFNTAAGSADAGVDLNISLSELHDLEHVHERSDVIPDDFRDIARDQSQAWSRTQELGPYDVVNLDLCDGVAAEEPGAADQNFYNALQQLLALQAKRSRPWLLFLTTRVDLENIDPLALERFNAVLMGNLRDCDDFHRAVESTWALSNADELAEFQSTANGLGLSFACGLSKWISALAADTSAMAELVQVDGYKVRTDSDAVDLMSLAWRVTPKVFRPGDRHGIATLPATHLESECDLAVLAVSALNSLIDVDELLAKDDKQRRALLESTRELLVRARHRGEAYDAWIEGVEPAGGRVEA